LQPLLHTGSLLAVPLVLSVHKPAPSAATAGSAANHNAA